MELRPWRSPWTHVLLRSECVSFWSFHPRPSHHEPAEAVYRGCLLFLEVSEVRGARGVRGPWENMILVSGGRRQVFEPNWIVQSILNMNGPLWSRVVGRINVSEPLQPPADPQTVLESRDILLFNGLFNLKKCSLISPQSTSVGLKRYQYFLKIAPVFVFMHLYTL